MGGNEDDFGSGGREGTGTSLISSLLDNFSNGCDDFAIFRPHAVLNVGSIEAVRMTKWIF
jgi:hypothetical protein